MAATVQNPVNNRRFLTCIYAPEVQTLGNQKIQLKENHDWKVEAEGEAKRYHSLPQAAKRFLESAEGLFRVGQLGERIPFFINAVRQEYGQPRIPELDTCGQKFVSSWKWLTTIPRTITMTPGTINAVKEARSAWNDSSITQQQRRFKFEKATSEVTDAAAMYSYSLATVTSLFPKMSHVGMAAVVVGDTTTMAHDSTSLKMNAENYLLARKVDLSKATPTMRNAVEQTKVYAMWAAAKDAAAAASGFFGLLFLATGISVLPSIAFITLGLAATTFAVIRKLYEETMHFKPINFLDNKFVTQIA